MSGAATSLRRAVKETLVRRAYGSGILDTWHRYRNRQALTVIMYHRVIDPGDVRWLRCDPEYSLSTELFEQTLLFFRRHYNLVTAEDVLAARHRPSALPEVPLLITIDDGWADTAEFAAPLLERYRCPSLLFVATDVVGRPDAFWQEQLVGAWRSGRLTPTRLAEVWDEIDADSATRQRAQVLAATRNELAPLRELIAHLERQPSDRRQAVLAKLYAVLADPTPQMISLAQLRGLPARGMSLGGHGHSHTPLTDARNPGGEINESRQRLFAATGAYPRTMSFPHGAHTEGLVSQAHDLGYELLFTSRRKLNNAEDLAAGVLGRAGFTAETVCDERGRYCPERLAWFLFRLEQPRGRILPSFTG